MVIWPQIVGFLLIGYLSMARSFAYLGVPLLYIGEIALAAFLLLKPRSPWNLDGLVATRIAPERVRPRSARLCGVRRLTGRTWRPRRQPPPLHVFLTPLSCG